MFSGRRPLYLSGWSDRFKLPFQWRHKVRIFCPVLWGPWTHAKTWVKVRGSFRAGVKRQQLLPIDRSSRARLELENTVSRYVNSRMPDRGVQMSYCIPEKTLAHEKSSWTVVPVIQCLESPPICNGKSACLVLSDEPVHRIWPHNPSPPEFKYILQIGVKKTNFQRAKPYCGKEPGKLSSEQFTQFIITCCVSPYTLTLWHTVTTFSTEKTAFKTFDFIANELWFLKNVYFLCKICMSGTAMLVQIIASGFWWVIFQRGEYTKPMGCDGWFSKGGSTQNRWAVMGDFSKGGVHKTNGSWWVIFQRGEYTKPMGCDGFWNLFFVASEK